MESVSDNGYEVNLATPLAHDHHGVTDTFDDNQSIELRYSYINVTVLYCMYFRAEVGLLTHNVIIQGSLIDSNPFEGQGADQYGAQVFIHRAGPHPTPIR